MSWFRSITVLLAAALLWVGLLGAGAGSAMHNHGHPPADQAVFAELIGAAEECCEGISERSSSCASMVAMTLDHPAPVYSFAAGTALHSHSVDLPDGRDPHDLLDPPRVT